MSKKINDEQCPFWKKFFPVSEELEHSLFVIACFAFVVSMCLVALLLAVKNVFLCR